MQVYLITVRCNENIRYFTGYKQMESDFAI